MDNKLNERLDPFGFSITQFSIIMTILEQEGRTQTEIGQRVMLPGYATTRNIDRVESLGYVKKKRHQSSLRSYRIQITEAGRALAPELYRATISVNELFLSTLEDEQKTELLNILSVAANKPGLYSQD